MESCPQSNWLIKHWICLSPKRFDLGRRFVAHRRCSPPWHERSSLKKDIDMTPSTLTNFMANHQGTKGFTEDAALFVRASASSITVTALLRSWLSCKHDESKRNMSRARIPEATNNNICPHDDWSLVSWPWHNRTQPLDWWHTPHPSWIGPMNPMNPHSHNHHHQSPSPMRSKIQDHY